MFFFQALDIRSHRAPCPWYPTKCPFSCRWNSR